MTDVPVYQLHINGRWRAAHSGQTLPAVSPYTGKEWALFSVAEACDVDAAVKAAVAAQQEWRATDGKQRGKVLYAIADALEKSADRLVEVECRDNGKLIREVTGQVESLPDYYRYWAGWTDKLAGTVIPVDKQGVFAYTLREPLGVIAAITAWNSPLLLLTWKLAAALATGNTVVAKPSEHASISTLEFAEIVARAGLPPGALNVVTGPGEPTGAALCAHPDVAKILFTGGTRSAHAVSRAAATNVTPVSMELGGKSPNIVFDDADIDAAVTGVMGGIFSATGQTCVAGSRILVHEAVAHQFVEELVTRSAALTVGDPMDPATDVGPVCFGAQLDRITGLVDQAVEAGARVLTGGRRGNGGAGLFYEPTILSDVARTSPAAYEEIFGPVGIVQTFRSEQEAVAIGNDTDFGLAAGIWTNDLGKAHRVAAALKVGMVWVNSYRIASYATPWGGVKRSGHGVENGEEAIRELTHPKSVMLNIGAA